MSAYSSPVSCSSQPVRLGGQCLEPVPLGAQPGQLGVVLLVGHDVRVQFPDPVADLLKLVLVVEALDQDEPLDRDAERGGHDLVHRRVRHLHPHHVAAPLAAAPRAGAPVITACCLPARRRCAWAPRSPRHASSCCISKAGCSASSCRTSTRRSQTASTRAASRSTCTNTMRVRQARAYMVHRPALRASLPGAPEPSPDPHLLLVAELRAPLLADPARTPGNRLGADSGSPISAAPAETA